MIWDIMGKIGRQWKCIVNKWLKPRASMSSLRVKSIVEGTTCRDQDEKMSISRSLIRNYFVPDMFYPFIANDLPMNSFTET
jgi:hypothetical protein